MATNLNDRARRLRNAVEPVAAGAYFAPGVYNVGGGPHFGSGLTIDTAAELHANRA
jgi:hypothetical protein